ncbi:acyltransferase family protein [Microbispora sp. H13382]|uniref:acyltransferase family protein n=1 Tax=Microbispora sp. H13382 TaxID=2729112 RepID=UPI0016036AB4|nr:acyltransferase family protein [Microbispora sp. H13382]
MSDTRHHPPVPGSPQGNDPDAEEAPTGVIGRITGDWPAPEGGLPRREPKPAGDPGAEQGAGGSGGPASERPEHGRHESGLPAPGDESTAAPAHGRHGSDESAPGSTAGSALGSAAGSAPYDKPYEKQPLPVRKPRKPGASRLGMPPASAPQPEGFDYFSAGGGQERPGAPRAAAAADGPAWPQAFPEHGPRNLSDAFPGAGPQPGFGQRDASGLRGGSDAPTPPFGDSPAFPAPAFGAAPPFPEPPGFPEPPPSFPEPPGLPQQPAAAADRTANPFLDTPPSGVGPAFPPDDPFGAAPPFPETTHGRRGVRDFPDAFPGAASNAAFGPASAPEAPAPAWPGQEADPAQWDPWRRSSQDGAGDPRQTGPLGRPLRAPLPAWAEVPLRPDDAFARGGGQDDRRVDEPEQEAAPRAKKPRDPYLDNVKFVGIALVPIGHALVPTLAADSARATYLFIYVFHMPLFVIISGYLSRNFWNSNAKTNKLVDTFLVPYVIVEVGYALLRTAFGHKFSLTIMDPAWLNWYLLALLFWRLSTPVWKRMKYPFAISVAVYLFAGFSQLSGDFSMDRFFGLLPFFVLGLVLKPEVFDFLKQRWVMMLSVVVLLGAAGVAVFLVKNYSVKLGPIYYKDSYKDLHLAWWKGMLLRTGLLVAALAMSAAVMSLIPRRQTWFTDLGTRTLYCYLLHGVPVMIAKEMGWVSFPWLYGPLGVAAIAASGFALAIVLCLPVTRTAFKWLLEPRLTWLYRRPSGQAPKPVSTGS